MIFGFKHFQFDCDLQLLIQDGNVITLNEKPAQLLTLFLLNVDKIHSKADILEYVWSGRVVTDQVVFQNICYLRSLFGSDAIKTFTRKGYKWQLPLSVISDEKKHLTKVNECNEPNAQVESNYIAESSTSSPDCDFKKSPTIKVSPISKNQSLAYKEKNKISVRYEKFKKFFLLLACFIALLIWLYLSSENSSNGKTSTTQNVVTLMPFKQVDYSELAKEVTSLLTTNGNIELSEQKQLTSQKLFDSPFQTWQSLKQSDQNLLLSFKLYPLNGEMNGDIALRFYLQGKHRGWQGYIIGSNKTFLAQQLKQLLESVQSSVYFSLESSNAALAQFVLLQNAQPNNPVFKQQLIELYYQLEDFDMANALLDNELNKPQHLLYLGLYHLLKSKVLDLDEDRLIVKQHIMQSIDIFSQLNTPQLESIALIPAAWLAFLNNDKNLSSEYLNSSANKARVANEPLLEVKAHLTQSYMASKSNHTALMHSQMVLAKQLISLHQLGDEHQISVLINLAWSSHSSTEKFDLYHKILNTTFSPLYRQNFYFADEYVKAELIKQQQFQQVLENIKPWQRTSYAMVTRAQVSFAQQHWQQAGILALEAFTSARIANENSDALDAALLLLQYENQLSDDYNFSEYRDYVSQNPTNRWRRINQKSLEVLGL